MSYCSCLLLFSILIVFSNVNAASVHKRGIIPTNINIDIKLGKGSAAKNIAPNAPSEGRKTVLNAPFGLASLTITTNRKNSSTNTNPINEPDKPCNPETENIATSGSMKKPSGTLGGKGDAFFGPPPMPPPHQGYGPPMHSHPHPGFGPPPPDFHHPHHHYPPPPPHHHFHHHPHEYHPDCNHEEPFSPINNNNKVPIIPENKPDAKVTRAPTSNEKIPQGTNVQSTTDNVDALIGDVFGGSNSQTSTTMRTNIDTNDREQTGEGNLDIRMPSSR